MKKPGAKAPGFFFEHTLCWPGHFTGDSCLSLGSTESFGTIDVLNCLRLWQAMNPS